MVTQHRKAPSALLQALVLGAATLVWLYLNSQVFFPMFTDENVHLYVARRVAQGAVLYRDIHSARPPLGLAPLVVGLWAGLPPLLAARCALLLCVLATALVLWWTGRRQFGVWSGTAAAALFLLAPEVSVRHAWTGIHMVALGALVCVALAPERPLAAGIAGGLALASGQHAAVLIAGAGTLCALRGRSSALTFVGGGAVSLGGILGVAALLAGPSAVWADLGAKHLYHLGSASNAAAGDLGLLLSRIALDNLPWAGLAVVSVLWPLNPGGEAQGQRSRWQLAALAAAHLGVVGLMTGGFVLYLFPAVPLVALLAGDGLVRMVSWTRRASRPAGRARRGLAMGGLLAALVGFGWSLGFQRSKREGEAYSVIPHLRGVERARMQRLTVLQRVEEAVAPVLREGETVFGVPPLAGALALDLNRRVAGELADLAPRWIALGLVTHKSIIETIEADGVRVFIAHQGSFERDPKFGEYLARCYGPPQVFERELQDGRGVPALNVYQHIEGPCLAPKGPRPNPVQAQPAIPSRP